MSKNRFAKSFHRIEQVPISRSRVSLSDDEKAWLINRFTHHPDAGYISHARMFFRQFGRDINVSTIRRAMINHHIVNNQPQQDHQNERQDNS